jgi:hypothetical protein
VSRAVSSAVVDVVIYYYLSVGRAHLARSEVRDSARDGGNV